MKFEVEYSMGRWSHFALVFAIAAQPVAFAQDEAEPTAQRVSPKVVLDADEIFVNETENIVIAEGNVEARYEGRVMRADRLVYDRAKDKVRASGGVIIIDTDGTERYADEIETDSNLSDGFAIGFSTRIPDGGIATAASAIRTSDGFNALDKVVYTACELCEGETKPTWALRARRAVLDQNDQMITYGDAVLEVAGIPVFYLPYFAHPDPNSDRRSGLLIPDIGLSSKLGAFYQQPYYWAISPSQDLTVSPLLAANVNPLLEFEYRKRFWSGEVNANFSFTNERDFDSDGEKFGESEWRGHLFAEGDFNITDDWAWGFGIEQVSDDLYTRRYDIDGANDERGIYDGLPLRLLTQVYLQGQQQNWYADASFLSFEGLRENDDDDTFPKVLPLFYGQRLFDLDAYGIASVTASSAVLDRDVGVDSQRISIETEWSLSRVLAGGVIVNPFIDGRYDAYNVKDNIADSEGETFTRGGANIGARLSYPLYRPGENIDLIVEPLAMVAYGTPGVNDARIPVEDSLLYEADESSLFDSNAMSGYDLYDGGAKASLGLSATAHWKSGAKITALAGRRWRSEADGNFGPSSNLDGTVSDWVAGVSATFGDPLKVETRIRLDEDDFAINRIDARLRSKFWRFEGQARYYKVSGDVLLRGTDDEGVDMSAKFRVTDQYSFTYARARDIEGNRDLRHSFGIAYEDDCSRFEIAYEQSERTDRTLGPEESIRFRFSLLTLGDFGSSDVD